MKLKHLLFHILFLVTLNTVFGQLSTKHFIPPITSQGNDISEQYIYISTPRNANISFSIKTVGNPDNDYAGIVTNTNPFLYRIVQDGEDPGDPSANLDTDGDSQLAIPESLSNTIIKDRGYIIEASDVIYVSVRFRSSLPNQYQAGALVSKGLSALGTEFRVGGMATENNNAPNGFLTYTSVMATEDDTNITFEDFPTGITVINHAGSTPINVNLSEGQSYMIAVASNYGGTPNDLIGSLVSSDKPIVVNSGSGTGSFADGNGGRDFGIDQIVDFSKVGSEYVFVKGNGGATGNSWENVLVVAHQDNTDIFIGANTTVEATINAGEWYVIEGNEYSTNGNLYVQTSNPVFAYQGIGGQVGSVPNQGMFFVPPLSCENRGDVDNIASIDQMGDAVFSGGVSIVTNKLATITINGLPITDFSPEGPFSVDGNPNYETYKVGLSGNVSVQSSGELYCAYFNQNGFAASGSFYSGFPSPPEINLDTNVSSLGNCIPNVTLQSVNTDLFDSVEWFYDDGTGFVSTGNITGTLVPTEPGNYRLTGTLVCSGATFESQIIPVSRCPDDLDNDLIIDNVDVDLDNDGILNCDESLGNVNLDFSDINAPILNFEDGSLDASFITSSLIQNGTSSISGDGTSNITTVIDAGATANLIYTLDFNEPINIEFTQNSGIPHTIINGETFILSIGPNSKNITLIDPDNILLVDTDFDDIFEDGVNNFSASEVRFRFNPTPNGTTPFKLVANSVNQLNFNHILNNNTDNSTFNGNVILTCFGIDRDNDGIVDAFDADSDNDGITDIIEAQGTGVILTGVDTNLDGLDDVFTSPITPIDSDNDGVYDYLDLDSDNDGVYDLFEAGHTQLDADLNGIIDNSSTSVGINGLVDALETIADNFILNYTVSDLDADTIFSYLDPDSDGDNCTDVIEAGYTDPDNDDFIGSSPVTVDEQGIVIGITDGYTIPNSDYSIGAPIVLNTPFEDVAFCQLSTSTITIDSTADTFQWEVSTDNGATWNSIIDDTVYNGSTSTTLQISNLQLSLDNNLYRVFLQRAGNSCDDTSNSIKLTVDALPTLISTDFDIQRCDEDRSGFVDFDLITDQTPQILNSLDPILNPDLTEFEVLYFDTLAAAEANTTAAIIANPYRVNTSDNPTIYGRIHNINNTTCYTIVEFKLKVTDTPTPTQPSVYKLCDDTASGSDIDQKSLFLLNTKDAEILTGVTNPGDYFISYHTDLTDAQTSSTSNAIDKNADYEVTISQRIYVRIENIDNVACNTVSDDSPGSTFTSFELIVDPLPIITDIVELKQCDDDTDGFSLFNLNEAATDISTNFANETFVFYPSLVDAENDTNAYTAAEVLVFRNRTVTTDIVWARAISSENCYRIAQVDIIVSTTGLPSTFERSFSVCDDFLDIDGNDTANNDDNDGISAFDFSSVTAEVRALFPVSQQLTITYYRNQADALAELNAIADPSNYRNIGYPVTQQIYIRVDSDLDNDCLGFGPYITLTVEPVTAQEVLGLELCDDLDDGDGFNGIVQTFNLESQTATILGTQDPSDFTVTYHNSPADALSGNAPIATPAMYENIIPNLETIFVRVENNLSGCFTAQTSFDLIVNPLPVANFVEDLEVCDDNTDGSAQNGFSQIFDLELQTAGILDTQDPAQFTVTYHASLADAQAGALPLGSPFSNSVPFSQIIYARVYNSLTGCANGISNFNAIVNPEPTTENASNLSYCDDDLDGDDTNGFVQNIDLDSQITEILGPLQDPDDFNVTFHETQTDATDGTDALSSPYTNTTANQQTIYVRVENKDTECVNDDFTFDVIVNPLPEFTVTSPQIVCLSGPDLTIFVENPAAVYDYVWTDPSGNDSIGSQITISSGGLYTVTATTTNGTGCTRTREILVNESSVATITDADVTIVDDSDNNSITIDPTNLGIGDYQYALIDEDGVLTSFQDLPFFENLQGGFYTIVVQDKNGCRPNAKLLVSVIEFPKFFTPNNDGINDTWAIKGVNSTFFPSAQINIFNRFGKIVAQIDIDTQGWDGTYGGKILASDDYWFSIMLVDRNGALRERKGNFSLLRR
ncbi:T9SS type B sorting domain-containing protein [Flavobacteriaceae bacterium]|nr:T9SS type B sorting domain-containing protein [Flavobacteriaceae bacterium]